MYIYTLHTPRTSPPTESAEESERERERDGKERCTCAFADQPRRKGEGAKEGGGG